MQLVRLTIQSLDCNDPAHCFGAVTINEKPPTCCNCHESTNGFLSSLVFRRLHPFRTACGSIRANSRICFAALLQKGNQRLYPLRDHSTVEETEYHQTIRYKFPSTLEKRYRKVSRSKFNNDSSSRKSKENRTNCRNAHSDKD